MRKMWRWGKFAGTALLGLGCLIFPAARYQPVQAAPNGGPGLLYATADFGSEFVAINLQSNKVTVIGETGYPFSLGLAFCPPGQQPYTITNTFAGPDAQLATINLQTGAATPVGSPLGQSLSIMGLTCSPTGTLYAIGRANSLDPDFNSLD